jgi:undecaprenyl-diphosphatase
VKSRFLLLVLLFSLAAFLLLAFFRGSFSSLDLNVNSWAISIHMTSLTVLALGVSDVFDTYVLLVISLVVATVLFARRHGRYGLFLLGAMGGVTLLVAVAKIVIQSHRPPNGLIFNSGFSFPSGHVTGSIVFVGVLTYFAWRHWNNAKAKSLSTGALLSITVLVGFDRIYLNVHWLSDVIGGCFLGTFWLTFSIMAFKYLESKKIMANNFLNIETVI